LTVGILNSVF